MALKMTITKKSNFGDDVIFTDCYIRVITVSGGKDRVLIDYGFFREKAGFSVGGGNCWFVPDMSGPNFIAQAYNHLKTLPEFAGAVDC